MRPQSHRKLARFCNRQPVKTALAIPARFPQAFCSPVQRPAASGPASVCVNANGLDAYVPKPRQLISSPPRAQYIPGTSTVGNSTPVASRPHTRNPRRNQTGEAPRPIHRSASTPPHNKQIRNVWVAEPDPHMSSSVPSQYQKENRAVKSRRYCWPLAFHRLRLTMRPCADRTIARDIDS